MIKRNLKYIVVVCIFVIAIVICVSVLCGKNIRHEKNALTKETTIKETTTKESITEKIEEKTQDEQETIENVTETISEDIDKIITETVTFTEELSENEIVEEETTTQPQYAAEISGIEGTGMVYNNYENAPLIAIDAGHQLTGNSDKEPIGPGAEQMKAKVASGTYGKWSGLNEYQLTLMVSMKLRDAFINNGYNVIMIRETNEVNISNAERAEIANSYNADVFLRIHANGMDDSSVNGVLTMCQTSSNPYCGEYYNNSRKLSDNVVNAIADETGARNRGVLESDTMSGINWCRVPVTIVEMGFMSNETEDILMATEDYQNKIVNGIVRGVAQYFSN